MTTFSRHQVLDEPARKTGILDWVRWLYIVAFFSNNSFFSFIVNFSRKIKCKVIDVFLGKNNARLGYQRSQYTILGSFVFLSDF